MYWEKLTREEINQRVSDALAENVSYASGSVLGVPATYLDEEEFYADEPFLEGAPFLRTLIANPNHIGCHTLEEAKAQTIFKGTQKLERRLIRLLAEEIFRGSAKQQDGYIATGGTEANIEALWIYRNYFRREFGAKNQEIGVVYSMDTHYSIPKGCNILDIQNIILEVNEADRRINIPAFEAKIEEAVKNGIRYFVVISNLSTTMFGSVDPIEPIASFFEKRNLEYKLHVDGAFGGFIYPFTNANSEHHFANPRVNSISLDGHKMLQTPYGTGVFLIRKGFMKYVTTDEAQYVPGLDYTICGSRSGANAVVILMILHTYGPEGWKAKMKNLIARTDYLCEQLDRLGVKYFREPGLNIVTIRAEYISRELGNKYELVADSYEKQPKWYKIVVMSHVKTGYIDSFLAELKSELSNRLSTGKHVL